LTLAIASELVEQVGRNRLGARRTFGRALELAERALAVDGLNEGLWRRALEAEGVLGLREAVEERYERLCAQLDERLGVEPDRETRALHRQLLAQA
jgi:DNA-binding SARP family transcriptional activator